MVRRNVGAPMYMRGPGAVPGLYALEVGMNELADELKMDPLQLRLLNDAEKDESNNTPFSSRHLRECFEVGAKKFGWDKRTAGHRLHAPRRQDSRLGAGRRKLGRDAPSLHGDGRVLRQRTPLRSLRHAGHRHRNLHDLRAGAAAKRPASRSTASM